MTRQDSAVTLAEVARVSGVSSATASRSINRRAGVSAEVRERVLAVAESLGYQPNSAARQLAGGRSGIIGFALPSSGLDRGSHGSLLVQGLSQALERRDLSMMVWTTDSARERTISEMAHRHQLDGMIIACPTMTEPWVVELLGDKRPAVFLDSVGSGLLAHTICTGNYNGAKAAVTHLVESGRKRIAHLSGPVNRYDSRDRQTAYLDVCEAYGFPTDGLVRDGGYTRHGGQHGMRQLLPLEPDAVFAAGDSMALGAIQTIRDAGLRVPEDIAVVGYNDTAEADTDQVQLSSVQHNRAEIAESGVALLERVIRDPSMKPQTIEMTNHLVIRDSSRPNSSD